MAANYSIRVVNYTLMVLVDSLKYKCLIAIALQTQLYMDHEITIYGNYILAHPTKKYLSFCETSFSCH